MKVIIAGMDPLHSFGLAELLKRSVPHVELEVLNGGEADMSGADFHIVGSCEFFSRLQYYMPRKSRVAVFVDKTNTTSSSLNDTSTDIMLVCADEPLESIASRLSDAISGCCDSEQYSTALTPREKEVLVLIAHGSTIKEIASELGISVNTTLTHRKNISAKLGIRSVSGLSLYAMINGML